MKYSSLRLPWEKVEKGQGFFIPCLDTEAMKEWKLYNAFPIQFTAGSDLDAAADDSKSIASLTLAYDDFEEVI